MTERCETCGGVVPVGEKLCQLCGMKVQIGLLSERLAVIQQIAENIQATPETRIAHIRAICKGEE